MLRVSYAEKATEARHRLERQYNACANRKKQCRPKSVILSIMHRPILNTHILNTHILNTHIIMPRLHLLIIFRLSIAA